MHRIHPGNRPSTDISAQAVDHLNLVTVIEKWESLAALRTMPSPAYAGLRKEGERHSGRRFAQDSGVSRVSRIPIRTCRLAQ